MSIPYQIMGRDVHIYDVAEPDKELGGLVLTNGVTNANFYMMIELFINFEAEWFIDDFEGNEVPKDDAPLRPGNYYLVFLGHIQVAWEEWLSPYYHPLGFEPPTRLFTEEIRARDNQCLISGTVMHSLRSSWRLFSACHIFPVEHEREFVNSGLGGLVTVIPAAGGAINSVQNGFLLRRDIHLLFRDYDVSVNPDDNYKVVCFDTDILGIAGRHIDPACLQGPRRPLDDLLRWHFRQAVLANMRGPEEPMIRYHHPFFPPE